MAKLLIVGNDVVAPQMAGPGIRCLELGRQLARAGHAVTVTGVGGTVSRQGEVTVVGGPSPSEIREIALVCDALVLEGLSLVRYPSLQSVGKPLIVDLYDPFPLAVMEQESHRPLAERELNAQSLRHALRQLLRVGDYFICASERQRDLWLGALLAAGRVNPQTWDADPSLRALVDVVPFGVSTERVPLRTATSRKVFGPRFRPEDTVLLWGGGIYNWFDPLTLLRALAVVVEDCPQVKLVFMSTGHPQLGVEERMWMPARARELSDSLALTGKYVFFNETWVPYEERGEWLAAADIGVSVHYDHAETRYSFRTRVLDYLWAGLPIICSGGDVLSDLVAEARLGWVTPPGDPGPLAEAIRSSVEDPAGRAAMRERVRRVAASMTWEQAVEPLLRYCEHLGPAPDAGRRRHRRKHRSEAGRARQAVAAVRVGLRSLATEGPITTARKVARWVRLGRDR